MKLYRYLLLFFPIAVAAEIFHWGDLVIFATTAMAFIPIAGIWGEATEALAAKTGPRIEGVAQRQPRQYGRVDYHDCRHSSR